MYTIEILNKRTKCPTDYIVNNRKEIVQYLFDEGEKFYRKKFIGACMRDCVEIMQKYPDYLAKVKRI